MADATIQFTEDFYKDFKENILLELRKQNYRTNLKQDFYGAILKFKELHCYDTSHCDDCVLNDCKDQCCYLNVIQSKLGREFRENKLKED